MGQVVKKPKTLVDLFVVREKAVNRATKKIFDSLSVAIDAISIMMDVETINKEGGKIVWDDVSLVGEEEDPFVILIGYVSYPVGSELTTPRGDKVKITETTQPYFRRLIRAGFPSSLTSKTKEEIVEYFKKLEEEKFEQMDVEPEFDLSQLTEEQRKAYESVNFKIGKA
jgi:hypothetical protein